MKRILTVLAVVALLGYAWWAFSRPSSTVDVAPAAPTGVEVSVSSATTHPSVAPGQLLDADGSEPAKPVGSRPTVSAEPLPTHRPEAHATATVVPTGLPRGLEDAVVDLSTPDAAATAFAQRYFTVDTTVDTNPAAGRARAAQVASRELAGTLTTAVDNGRPGGEWLALLEHQGWTTATPRIVTLGDAPADSTTAYRAVKVAVDLRGEDSWIDTRTHLMSLELTHADDDWKTSKYQLLE